MSGSRAEAAPVCGIGATFGRLRLKSSPADCLCTVAPTWRPRRSGMERDNDIEFDFFEEPETTEAPPPVRRAPRRGGPRRPVRPAAGFTPLLRLVGLIAFAILVVVLLVLWVQGCRSNAKKDSYRHYMDKLTTIAKASSADGDA